MTSVGREAFRVEATRAGSGETPWAWAIYRGAARDPVDRSMPMFPDRETALRVGTTVMAHISGTKARRTLH